MHSNELTGSDQVNVAIENIAKHRSSNNINVDLLVAIQKVRLPLQLLKNNLIPAICCFSSL